jgi:diguanylate cyclase (GGDEF)-like protein
MISLKRFIESKPEETRKTMCESYRTSLTAMGVSATQICPHIGEDFQRDLLKLRDRLSPDTEPELVAETGKQVEEELKRWGENASEYFHQTAHDVKELMLVVAEAAQALGDRDQRYAQEFVEVAGQLAAIGSLQDLTKVRQSLGKSATQLKSCVEKMVQDGQQSVSRLRAELSVYQSRLDEVERVATQDAVTGVANRYKAERQLHLRIERARNLSVAMFDLDNFKQTNDVYGHPAGDALLQQFAAELRAFFRSTDMVSRWGGDEFLVIVDCTPEEAQDRVQPVRKWIDGDYTIQINGQPRTVKVRASVGVASWRTGETASELVARADAAMYAEKAQTRKAAKESAKEGVSSKQRPGL